MCPKKFSSYYEFERPEMLMYIPKSTSFCLDIGCGAGNFGAQIKRSLGCKEVWGIEIFEKAGNLAKKKLDRVIVADAVDAVNKLPNHYFDCVVCNDILEHLVDPYGLLLTLRDKLSSCGTIVASIPNVRHYKNLYNLIFKRQWKYEESGIMDKTHLRFFTEVSIRDMFENAGYSVNKIEGLFETRKAKARVWGWLTFGWFDDIRYTQFACVASPKL